MGLRLILAGIQRVVVGVFHVVDHEGETHGGPVRQQRHDPLPAEGAARRRRAQRRRHDDEPDVFVEAREFDDAFEGLIQDSLLVRMAQASFDFVALRSGCFTDSAWPSILSGTKCSRRMRVTPRILAIAASSGFVALRSGCFTDSAWPSILSGTKCSRRMRVRQLIAAQISSPLAVFVPSSQSHESHQNRRESVLLSWLVTIP